METFIACVVTGAAGLVAGTIWGRKIEQKAVAAVMADFQTADAEARSFVNRLYVRLPWLAKLL
jgi:hypothetical protein